MIYTPISIIYDKTRAAGSNPPAENRLNVIENSAVTEKNAKSLLIELVGLYEKAAASGKRDLARKCQTAAIKIVLFVAKNKLEIEGFKENAGKLGIKIPSAQSNWKKAFAGSYSTNALIQKAAANTFSPGGRQDFYTTAAVDSKETDEQVKEGMAVYDLQVICDESGALRSIGKAIVVSGQSMLKLGYLAGEPVSYNTAKQRNYLVFASANYTSIKNTPATLSIKGGKPHNLYLSPDMHGLVIIKNGRPKIINIKKVNQDGAVEVDYAKVQEATETALAEGGTVFQTNLIVYNGQSIVPPAGSEKRDVRRALVIFDDGSFGIVNFSESITLYELSKLLESTQVEGKQVATAVNLDTGGCNVGGYRVKTSPEPRNWGNNTKVETSTLLFIR